jgi:hypothetical protein
MGLMKKQGLAPRGSLPQLRRLRAGATPDPDQDAFDLQLNLRLIPAMSAVADGVAELDARGSVRECEPPRPPTSAAFRRRR